MDYVFKANLDLWTFSSGLPVFSSSVPWRITAEGAEITLGDLSDDAPIIAQNLLNPEELLPFLAFDIVEYMPADADAPTLLGQIDYLDFVDRGQPTFSTVRVTGPELPRPEEGEFIVDAYESDPEFLTFDPFGDGPVDGAPWGEGQPFDLRDVEGWEFLGQSETSLLPGEDADRAARVEDIALMYEAGLDRDGNIDEAGLNFWVDAVADRLTLRQLAAAFLEADEFRAAAEAFLGDGTDLTGETVRDAEVFSDLDYLSFLYGNVLDREPDQQGLDFWLARLEEIAAEPTAREQMLIAFARSTENRDASPTVDTIEETLPGIWEFA